MAVRRVETMNRRLQNVSHPHELLLVQPPAWMADSPCASTDPAIFYPEKGSTGNRGAAKRLCWDVCPVREECLEWALEFESAPNNSSAVFGIFGGLVPSERKRLIKERALAVGAES